jgi:putative hemolysin
MDYILEEIVGEISDELDEEKLIYSKLDNRNFLFEGKALLSDFSRIVGVDEGFFNSIKGEAEILAGLRLEINGEFPQKNGALNF